MHYACGSELNFSEIKLGRVDIYLSQSTEAASATNDAKRVASLS